MPFTEALVSEQVADLELDVGGALERELPARERVRGRRRGLAAVHLLLSGAHELLLQEVLRGHHGRTDQTVGHLVDDPGPVVARLAAVVEAEHFAQVDERADDVARLDVLQHEVADRGRGAIRVVVPGTRGEGSRGSVARKGSGHGGHVELKKTMKEIINGVRVEGGGRTWTPPRVW